METDIKKIICPDCGAEIIRPAEMAVGDILECGECGTEVEVTSLDPVGYRLLIEEK